MTQLGRRKALAWAAFFFLFVTPRVLAAPAQPAISTASEAAAQTHPPDTSTQSQQATQAQSPQQTGQDVKAYTLPPDLYEKAVKYSRAQYILYFVGFVWGLIVLLLVLAWRLAPKYRDWAERTTSVRFLQAVIFTPILLLTIAVLGLPVDIYGHWLSRSYGISVQSWSSWAGDWAKGQVLGFILGILLVWILYAIIRHSPRRWWLYFWLAALPILFFVIFLSPLVIDPMFNKFEPLQKTDPQLVTALEEVVHRAGMDIPPDRMFLMRASEKTNAVDAYVTGMGASKRVVVWDTTIQKMTVPETMFVFGHEMGHYVLNHVYKGLVFGALGAFVLLYLGFRGAFWMLSRCSRRWSIRSTDDWASLPVLLLWLAILISSPRLWATPSAGTSNTRRINMASKSPMGCFRTRSKWPREVFRYSEKWTWRNPDPNPFIKVWLFSHPPLAERVNFALTYDPWAEGKQPEFVKGQ